MPLFNGYIAILLVDFEEVSDVAVVRDSDAVMLQHFGTDPVQFNQHLSRPHRTLVLSKKVKRNRRILNIFTLLEVGPLVTRQSLR